MKKALRRTQHTFKLNLDESAEKKTLTYDVFPILLLYSILFTERSTIQ